LSSRRCRRYIGAHRSRSKDHQRVEGVLSRTLRMKSMGRFNRLEQTECEDVQGDSENGVSALSRRKQGFESPRERQSFQELNLSHRRWCPGCVPGNSSARPTIGSCVSAGSVLVALSDRHTKTFNTSEFESSRPSHAFCESGDCRRVRKTASRIQRSTVLGVTRQRSASSFWNNPSTALQHVQLMMQS